MNKGFTRVIIVLLLALMVILSGLTSAASGDPLKKIDPVLKSFLHRQGIQVGAQPPRRVPVRAGVRALPKQPEPREIPPARHPRRGITETIAHHRNANGQEVVPVIIHLRSGASPTGLKVPGLKVRSVIGQVLTAEIPASKVIALANQPEVISITGSHTVMPTNDVSIPAVLANQVQDDFHTKGKGAIVGVADTGVDWRHGDFIGPDGKSRILYIWDQTDNTGPAPAGYNYGTEYTKAQIDAALAGTGTVAERDNDPAGFGHGTHVLGTAAGNGLRINRYKGVAPEAEIIFVKLNWDLAAAIDANAYMLQKAGELGKPVAINNSWGERSGPRDGSSSLCKAFDALVGAGKPGKVICFAAGNDGESPYHTSGQVMPVQINNYLLQSTGEDYAVSTEVWYDSGSQLSLTLNFPANLNATPYPVRCQPGQRIHYVVNSVDTPNSPFIGATIDIDATRMPYPDNPGLNCISASFDISTMPGDELDLLMALYTLLYIPLDIQLETPGSSPVPFHAWGVISAIIPSENYGQDFRGNSEMTVLEPGAAANVITVGAYVTKTTWMDENGGMHSVPYTQVGKAASFTSRGPLRNGAQKPDISAPGQMIVSSLSADVVFDDLLYPRTVVVEGSQHQAMQGTSMASPHVTGASALILSVNPNLDCAQVKQILTSSARTDSYTGAVWNSTWGYGKMDVKAAVQSVTKEFITPQDHVRPGWNLISLPGEPVNPAPAEVFSGINLSTASLQFWNNTAPGGGWIGFNDNWTGPVEMGVPYWFLHFGSPTTIRFSGRPRLTDQTIQIPSHDQTPYWIMFGHPYEHITSCSDVQFYTSQQPTPLTWEAAYNAGLVSSSAIQFDAATSQFVTAGPASAMPNRTVLEPWGGYWLLVNAPGALSIEIPAGP